MADFVYNVAKGAAAEKIRDGANVQILTVDAGATTDATLRDLATVTSVLGSVTERTTNGWGRKSISNASVTLTVDNTNDRVDLDVPDQTWTAVSSGAVTDLIFTENTGSDSSSVPLTQHDFAITPDGSDVTATINVFYRAS